MNTPETNSKPTKRKSGLESGKFYTAPISVDEKFVTIKLPLAVADYFGLTGKKIFWAPVNGIIQLSPSSQPHMALSVMSVSLEQFIPHDAKVIDAGE